ncbi:MAG: DUF4174 domain-containing protein [Planctomycetota bacterium]
MSLVRLRLSILLPLALAAHSGCKPMSNPPEPKSWAMTDYAWSNRPLLVFASDTDDASLAEQRRLLDADPAGLAERHIVVLQAIGDAVTADGEPVNAAPADLRRQYNVDPDAPFTALLIGKDTGVKLRSDEPIALDRLFGVIDAMPMRRSEMREQARTD